MKSVKVYISNDTAVNSVIEYLENRIPEETKNSPEYVFLFPQIKSCIEDFSEKARKLVKSGTTIHINKEFPLLGTNIYVILVYPPRKISFFERIAGILKRE